MLEQPKTRPVLTYSTKYPEVAMEVVAAGLEGGYGVRAEPFEDIWTVRWWK